MPSTTSLEVDVAAFEARAVFVMCASGNRRMRAATAPASVGVQATSVAGGTTGWRHAGHPVVLGPHAA